MTTYRIRVEAQVNVATLIEVEAESEKGAIVAAKREFIGYLEVIHHTSKEYITAQITEIDGMLPDGEVE